MLILQAQTRTHAHTRAHTHTHARTHAHTHTQVAAAGADPAAAFHLARQYEAQNRIAEAIQFYTKVGKQHV